jgi:hypothetical protein
MMFQSMAMLYSDAAKVGNNCASFQVGWVYLVDTMVAANAMGPMDSTNAVCMTGWYDMPARTVAFMGGLCQAMQMDRVGTEGTAAYTTAKANLLTMVKEGLVYDGKWYMACWNVNPYNPANFVNYESCVEDYVNLFWYDVAVGSNIW